MHRFLKAAVPALAALLVNQQTQAQPTLAPSQALACMTPAQDQRGQPQYDQEALRRKEGGTVKVELVFSAPDSVPVVRPLSEDHAPWMFRAVLRHAEKFRVPCLTADREPVRLVQEYVFVPNDGRKVVHTIATDLAQQRRGELMKCITRIAGPAKPSYPSTVAREGIQDNIFVLMRFVNATQAPQVSYLTEGSSHAFRSEIEAFAAGYRMPCHQGEPVDVDYLFLFRLAGGDATRIKDLSLRDFLGGAKDVPRGVFFDLNTMKCPFDLRVRYNRPYRPNQVQELEHAVPERRALMDWIAQIGFKLAPAVERRILGDEFTLHVPCGTVDL